MIQGTQSGKPGQKKITELVSHIKQILDQGKDYDKIVRIIQNQIDGQQNQIRDLFQRNIDSVTKHYIKYYQVCQNQKKLESMCQQFDKKIQKTQKLSLYDEKMIDQSEKTLLSLNQVKQKLISYREHIRALKKTSMNLQQDKYNNSIKLYHKLSKSPLNISNTPLVKCLPLVKQQVLKHLQKLVDVFWDDNQIKEFQSGKACVNKILSNFREKSTIFQNFFGNRTNNRMSAISRNSIFRNSFLRHSTAIDSKVQSTISFLKNFNQDNQSLQKFIIRANVQMAPLKQVKLLCTELEGERQGTIYFHNLIKQNIMKALKTIHSIRPCQNQQDYKNLLSHLIGFILVCRQVTSCFSISLDQTLFIGEIYLILRCQLKSIITTKISSFSIKTSHQLQITKEQIQKSQQQRNLLKLKQFSDIFYMILKIVKIQTNPRAYTLLLEDLLKNYCAKTMEKYEAMIVNQINNDNLVIYKSQSQDEQLLLNQILGFNNHQMINSQTRGTNNQNNSQTNINKAIETNQTHKQYNFTGFVVFAITIFDQFYQYMLSLVKDTNCNKSILHQQLAQVLERIISLYGSQLIIKDHALHIAQGQVNILYCQKIFLFYSERLQQQQNYSMTCEPGYTQKQSQLLIQLHRRIRQLLQQKIQLMLSSYYTQSNQSINKSHVDYVEWLMQYLKECFNYLRVIRFLEVEELLGAVFMYVAHVYWQILLDRKQYSLIMVANLKKDLQFIKSFLHKHMTPYIQVLDKLKSLHQFCALMLTGNIMDLCDSQKRNQLYSSINMQTLISVLMKYNRVNCTGLRDLKKRDIQLMLKKLESQIN